MVLVGLSDVGPMLILAGYIIIALGQARNIVLLVREARTWFRKPKPRSTPRLPPPL